MKYKKYNEVKKQNKRKKIDKVIAGILCSVVALGVVAGGVAMAVPESRNWILDEVAKSSNVYKTQVAENDKLKIELGETKAQLESKQSEVTTLTEQKVVLLDAVTKIDNEINTTTDKTTLDNLQERKTAILGQVNELNGQIASKQSEIERLQARVEELESQQLEYVIETRPFKNLSFNYSLVEIYSIGFTDIGGMADSGIHLKDALSHIASIESFRIYKNLDIFDKAGSYLSCAAVEEKVYHPAETCNITTKIYDATDRLVNITELDDVTNYNYMSGFEYTLNDSEQITDFILTLRLDETIPEVTTPEQTVTADNLVIDISGTTSGGLAHLVYNENTKQYTVGESVRNLEFSSYNSENNELTFVDGSSNSIIFTSVEGSWQDGKFVVTHAFDSSYELIQS